MAADRTLVKLGETGERLFTLNGAGVAGIISLLQVPNLDSSILRTAGLVFISGLFASGTTYIISFNGHYEGKNFEIELKYARKLMVAVVAGGIAFVGGVVIAFVGAGGFSH